MLTINFYGGHPPLTFPLDTHQTVEDIIIGAAQVLEINPLCRHLFGLRDNAKRLWSALSKKTSTFQKNTTLQFRLRFKAHSLERLKYLDLKAFEYFFYQVRSDFLAGEIPELIADQEDGLGLVVTDVLLHLRNNPGKKVSEVELKSFMPKELSGIASRHNVKKKTEKLVETLQKRDASYICECYLSKIEESQCSYGAEEYFLQMDEAGSVLQIRLVIDAYHREQPGLRYCYASQKKGPWTHLCRLEELVFVSMRPQDMTVEVARETGVPCYFKFQALDTLESFVSCLSGYYRLIRTWTFDLCLELPTPSLEYLRCNKCHGPIGSGYSARKLKEKGGGAVGVCLLRESSDKYNTYKLDLVVGKGKELVSHVILKEGDKVHFKDNEKFYDSLGVMLKELLKGNDPNIKITRLLPPSDYDDAEPLLLCASRDKKARNSTQTGPVVISMDHLTSSEVKISRGRFSDLVVAQWTTQNNREVAVKRPKFHNVSSSESEFMKMLNKFCFVTCECIISILGVTLSPVSLVMEYLPLGPLDKYLQTHKADMKEVELVEAATYLARALHYLSLEELRHLKIRCHNVLVAAHTDRTFKVKLGDPGLVSYTQRDLHWIPVEHHLEPSKALFDITTDIWAFSTTLWQIFSYGITPLHGADLEEVRHLYAAGRLLPRPDSCPEDLYKVMMRCWSRDPQARRQPQEIMRDVNQILYQVFNSRKCHAYQTIYPATSTSGESETEQQNGRALDENNEDGGSITTQLTTLTMMDGSVSEVLTAQLPIVDDLISIGPFEDFTPCGLHFEDISPTGVNQATQVKKLSELLLTPIDAMRIPSLSALTPKPLDMDKFQLRLSIVIGEGNYGKVYKGKLTDDKGKVQTVAVKTLHPVGDIEDLKREFSMMKNLNHKNIVGIPCDLMETEQQQMCMVMEYLPMGSLKEYVIENKERLTMKSLLKFALDIAAGMDYLEECRIIHRDLAARNILVKDAHTVKVSDFGLAQKPNEGNYYILKTERSLPFAWYALECIESFKFSHKSDVWSYGVTCWEMFTRGLDPMDHLPTEPEELKRRLRNGHRLRFLAPCEQTVYTKLIRRCWDEQPSERPNFSEFKHIIRECQE